MSSGKRGDLAARGVTALQWLLQLLGVTKKDETATGLPNGQHVAQRHLTGLVDNKHVKSTNPPPNNALHWSAESVQTWGAREGFSEAENLATSA